MSLEELCALDSVGRDLDPVFSCEEAYYILRVKLLRFAVAQEALLISK